MEEKTGQEDIEEKARIFAALGDPTRLRLVRHLCRDCHGQAVCGNYLAAVLGITPSAVSQHLKILKNAGLVKGERRGYHVHYWVNPDAFGCCQRLAKDVLGPVELNENTVCDENCCKRRT